MVTRIRLIKKSCSHHSETLNATTDAHLPGNCQKINLLEATSGTEFGEGEKSAKLKEGARGENSST